MPLLGFGALILLVSLSAYVRGRRTNDRRRATDSRAHLDTDVTRAGGERTAHTAAWSIAPGRYRPLPHLSTATATGANAGSRPAAAPCAIRVAVVSKPPARRLLAAPDLLPLGSIAGALKLHDCALAERQHGSLVRRLTVGGDARKHNDMVAVGDKVLRLGPEGLTGQCDEELPDFVLAAISAADGAVARHDPFDVIGHVPHRTVEVGIRKRLVRGLGRGLVVGCGHRYLPVHGCSCV